MARYVLKPEKVGTFEGLIYALPEAQRPHKSVWNRIVNGNRINGQTLNKSVFERGLKEKWSGDFGLFLSTFFDADVKTEERPRGIVLWTNEDYWRFLGNNANAIDTILHVFESDPIEFGIVPGLREDEEDDGDGRDRARQDQAMNMLTNTIKPLLSGGQVGYMFQSARAIERFEEWKKLAVKPLVEHVLENVEGSESINVFKQRDELLSRLLWLPAHTAKIFSFRGVFIFLKRASIFGEQLVAVKAIEGWEPETPEDTVFSAEETIFSIVLDDVNAQAQRQSIAGGVLGGIAKGIEDDLYSTDLVDAWIEWLNHSSLFEGLESEKDLLRTIEEKNERRPDIEADSFLGNPFNPRTPL